MARLKSAVELEKERQELAKYALGQYHLDTTRLLLMYCRQSTDRQYFKSLLDNTEQKNELLEHAKALGWPLDKIPEPFVENDKNRHTSGTLSIEDRPKMKAMRELICSGKASAVLVVDVSRLFRDEDLIDPGVFAKECKQHHVVVITCDPPYVYDFNSPLRDDLKKFIDEAFVAAAFIRRQIKGKMLKARSKIAENGYLANGVAPVGLIRVQEEVRIDGRIGHRDRLAPTVHAPRVDWLFARYRAHQANLRSLLNEVRDMANRGEPLFPYSENIDQSQMFLSQVFDKDTGVLLGWTVASRSGLRHILTNPSYAGHLVFNGTVIKKDAFQAIVDPVNFAYAYNDLAEYDFDGQPIERPERVVRYTQAAYEDTGALLFGTRHDGTPVITGVGDSWVYVHRAETNRYSCHKCAWPSDTLDGYEVSISVRRLDGIFENKLFDYLKISETLTYCDPQQEEYNENWRQMVHSVDQSEQVSKPPDTTLEEIDSQIEQTLRNIDKGGKYMTNEELGDAWAKVGRLRTRKANIVQARANQERIKQELEQAERDVHIAAHEYQSWEIDRRRNLVRLVTRSITLEAIEQGHVRLTVAWSPVLGGTIEQCDIYKTGNNKRYWADWSIIGVSNDVERS